MNAMSKKEADACVEESCPPPTAPFGETKEQLGGFLLIKAGDPNEAIQVPRRSDARGVSIEVRPIKELHP